MGRPRRVLWADLAADDSDEPDAARNPFAPKVACWKGDLAAAEEAPAAAELHVEGQVSGVCEAAAEEPDPEMEAKEEPRPETPGWAWCWTPGGACGMEAPADLMTAKFRSLEGGARAQDPGGRGAGGEGRGR